MHQLDRGYTAEVDTVDEPAWCRELQQFDDANIYQTWSYDEVRYGRKNISQLVVKKNGNTVAIAQARLWRFPFIKAGVAYVRWGPVWRRPHENADPEVFRQAIRALHNEYACRRGLVLRVYPAVFRESSPDSPSVLAEEGFEPLGERPDRTLLLDLAPSLEELRDGLRPHWRRALRTAEKGGLEIVEGSSDDLFPPFVRMYKEMVGRKRFVEPNSIDDFRRIQTRLPAGFKMRILLCKFEGELCAGLICSAIGNTGIYLFGATSNNGLKRRGSYLLHWRLIEYLRQRGCAWYDLHGINPVTNPGTYRFKMDLCGQNGHDVSFLGRFDSYTNFLSYAGIACGDGLRTSYRTFRQNMAERMRPAAVEDAG